VRIDSGSGRKTLYLGAHASHIVGWPAEQGRTLLTQLIALTPEPRFVYQHHWRAGDLLVWDNRCTLHRARSFDDASARRDMRRSNNRGCGTHVGAAGVALAAVS